MFKKSSQNLDYLFSSFHNTHHFKAALKKIMMLMFIIYSYLYAL